MSYDFFCLKTVFDTKNFGQTEIDFNVKLFF